MRVPEFLGHGDRYKIEREVARGGMGAVYRAYDKNTAQWVAVKVMLDSSNPDAQALFDKEWRILAELQHPNIIGITDRGDFWDGNTKFPFFVMPFLRGKTLHECIHNQNEPMPVDRVVSIITAAADSLSAAHSRGVIHRDVKPSNIFVLEAGPVVVIDFGIVHLSDNRAGTSIKGTTPYMAPELLVPKKHERPGPSSDLFSLGVVCYEALTGKQPFLRQTTPETVEAILQEIPTPAYELNQKVSLILSQVVQKAMAKDRSHRYGSIKEFADKLERAFRSEPLPEFDRGAVEERLRVVREALAKGQTTSADKMLRSIEEDGLVDPAISSQRQKIDLAIVQKQVRELIESARLYREAKQYITAIEKLNEALAADPDNVDALTEKDSIEQERLRNTLNEARLLMQSHRFDDARRAIEDARGIRQRNTQITELMGELTRMEQADRVFGEQKESLYQEAQDANRDGRLTTALGKLEKVMELIRQSGPRSNSERDQIYKNFYEVVLEEHSRIDKAGQEVRTYLAEGRFAQAVALCDQVLATNPGLPLFEVLKLEAESRERESRLEYVNKVRSAMRDLPDLEMRLTMLQEAVDRYPNEPQLVELLKTARSKRDVVNGLLVKARKAESSGRFAECLEHWKTLRECHPTYPSIDREMERVKELHANDARAGRKAELVREISSFLRAGEYQQADDGCEAALKGFPGDADLLSLQGAAREGALRAPEVQNLIVDGRTKLHEGRTDDALTSFRRAATLDPINQQVRQFLGIALLDKIRAASGDDADTLLREAQELIPDHPELKSLAAQIGDRKRNTAVEGTLAAVQNLAAAGDHTGAVAKLEETLRVYPGERRLSMELTRQRKHLGEPLVIGATAGAGGAQTAGTPLTSLEDSVLMRSGFPGTSSQSPSSSVEAEGTNVGEQQPSAVRRLQIALRSSLVASQTWIRSTVDRVNGVVERLKESRADGGEQGNASRFFNRKIAAVGGVVVVAVLVVGIAYVIRGNDPEVETKPPIVELDITVEPADAEIFIDESPAGVSRVKLPFNAGETHEVSVSRIGYVTSKQSVTWAESKNLPVTLPYIRMDLRILSDQPGQVWLDDQQRDDLTPEGASLSGIERGVHKLKIQTTSGMVETSFDFRPAAPPLPFMPIDKAPTVLFVGSFNGQVRPECNCTATMKIGDSTQALEPGVEMTLPAGEHAAELSMSPGGSKNLTIATSETPTATIAVYWGPRRPPPPPSLAELLRQARASIERALRETTSGSFNQSLNQAEATIRQVLAREPSNQEAIVLQNRVARLRATGPQ